MFSIFNGENQGDLQRLKAKNPDRKEDATIIVARKTMKKVRIFAAMAALMTLGLAACGGENATESASAAPTSSKAASSAAKSSSKKPSSSKPVSSSKPAGPDYTQVIAHTWTDGTPAANADGKNYIPMTDSTANKVGVKIAIQNYEVAEGATATSSLSSDGKIGPVNDHEAALAWKIKAPKAGNYQLVMVGKCKSDAAEYTLAERAFGVKLNGAEVNVDAEERIAVTTEAAPFVAAPTIALSGPETEDVIAITCTDYRIQFDREEISSIHYAEVITLWD